MIAKKKVLIYNDLQKSSLQFSLQSCQLSPLIFCPLNLLSQLGCKEKHANIQGIDANFFAALFAKPSNSTNENN